MTFLPLKCRERKEKSVRKMRRFFLNVRIILIILTFKTSREGKFDIANSRISNFVVI